MRSAHGESGLSLIEVVVAIAVGSAVVIAGTTLVAVGLTPIVGAGLRAREAVQIFEVQRTMTRDVNRARPDQVRWELIPDPASHGYQLVRREERDGQWDQRVHLDGVLEVDPDSGRLRLRGSADSWVDLTPRRLSEP
jgi:type II secretory pathway pseudopilin PulG